MKIIKPLLFISVFYVFMGCSSNTDIVAEPVSVTFNFSHFFDGEELEASDFETTTFTNEYGTDLIINDARYLISDIVFTHASGEVTSLNEYNLVDVDDETGLSFTTSVGILPGEYSNVSFRFGFSEENNTTGAYPDLTSVVFDVNENLGGGYHYMQMDGTYIDENSLTSPFNYHVISAIDMTAADPMREDTSFEISLGAVTVEGGTNINVGVDLAGWFNNPTPWVLDVWDTMLMGNYDAQLEMRGQGQVGVFSLIDVVQE